MKKFVVALATVFAASVVFTGVAASGDGGKLVNSGFTCGILDGNGNVFLTTNSELWEYQDRAVLRCEGVGPAGPGPHPKIFNFANTGLSCGMLQFGSTTDWENRVGAKGKSRLVCQTDKAAAAASAGAGIG